MKVMKIIKENIAINLFVKKLMNTMQKYSLPRRQQMTNHNLGRFLIIFYSPLGMDSHLTCHYTKNFAVFKGQPVIAQIELQLTRKTNRLKIYLPGSTPSKEILDTVMVPLINLDHRREAGGESVKAESIFRLMQLIHVSHN